METVMYTQAMDLVYLPENNVSRFGLDLTSSSFKELVASLILYGFDISKSSLVVYTLTDKEKTTVETLRNAQLQTYRELKDAIPVYRIRESDEGDGKEIGTYETISITPDEITSMYHRMYFSKENTPYPAVYGGVSGNHRSVAILLANCVRAKEDKELILSLPCTVKTYASKIERFADTVQDNGSAQIGRIKLSPRDSVVSARTLFSLGVIEARFRKIFLPGTGQKLFALAKVDARFSKLTIIDKILAGNLDYGKIDKEAIRKLSKRTNASKADVELALAGKGKNESAIMDKTSIVQWARQTNLPIVRLVLSCILQKDNSLILPIGEKSDDVNRAIKKLVPNIETLSELPEKYLEKVLADTE